MSGRPAGSPHYLDLLSEVLPAGEKLVQRALGVLHMAAVLPIDQKPGQGAHAHSCVKHRGPGPGLSSHGRHGKRTANGSPSLVNLLCGSVLSVWLPSPLPKYCQARRAAKMLGTRGSPTLPDPQTQGGPHAVVLFQERTGSGMGFPLPPQSCPRKGQERSPCRPRAGGPQEGLDSCLQALSAVALPGSALAWGGGPRANISGRGDPGVSPCCFHMTPTHSAWVPGSPSLGAG